MAKIITIKELKELLELHNKWLNKEDGGKKLDLSNRDLTNPKVIEILRNANLRYANLQYANLQYANLQYANLQYAYLRYANLHNANLHNANLQYANLQYAYLRYANLHNANLHNAKNLPFIPMACPDKGTFIGWKKVSNMIIKLEIPDNAKRSSSTGRKCRCEFAKVLEIQNLDGSKAEINEITNLDYQPNITYVVGEMVYPDSFNEDRFNECSHGIHFFINRQEAVEY